MALDFKFLPGVDCPSCGADAYVIRRSPLANKKEFQIFKCSDCNAEFEREADQPPAR